MTEYLEGTLSAETRDRFETHLRGCDGCTEYLAQLRAEIAMSRRLSEDTLDPVYRDRLLAAFRDWKKR